MSPSGTAIKDGPVQAESRIPALDGLRGIAILLVLVCHFAASPELVPNKILYQIAYAGWVGVDLFFVLSGFLITRILLAAKDSPHYFRNFYMRRTLRIFPLYYGVLLVIFVVVPLFSHRPEIESLASLQGWLWTYGVNIKIASLGDWSFVEGWVKLGHFWSLAVEEHFYLFWPALVLALNNIALLAVCALFLPVAFAIRLAMLTGGVSPVSVYVLTFCRIDSLALGGLLAILASRPGGISRLVLPARWCFAASGAALLYLFVHYGSFHEQILAIQLLGYPLLAVFFGSVIVLSLNPAGNRFVRSSLSSRVLQVFGKYSYGIYVFHPLFAALFVRWFGVQRLMPWIHSRVAAVAVFTILSSLATLGIAAISWHLYEQRFLRLKRYFVTTRRSDHTSAAARSIHDAVHAGRAH